METVRHAFVCCQCGFDTSRSQATLEVSNVVGTRVGSGLHKMCRGHSGELIQRGKDREILHVFVLGGCHC